MTEQAPAKFRIGQVCDQLRADFPDISISKLRFLQDKGIVEPERSAGGYRLYSADDVAALRAALAMQRDEFLPLRVIKAELRRRLEGWAAATDDAGTAPGPSARDLSGAARSAGVAAASAAPRANRQHELRLDPDAGQRVSEQALLRAAHVDAELLDECRSAGIVSGERDETGAISFTIEEIALVRSAGHLVALGLDVRHLRQAATAAGRQGAIVEQYAAAMLRAPGAEQRQRAVKTVEELASELAEFLRVAFLRDVRLVVESATGRRSPAASDGTSGRQHAPQLL